MSIWPSDPDQLGRVQHDLARLAAETPPWRPSPDRPSRIAAVYAAFPTGLQDQGAEGDTTVAAAAVFDAGRRVQTSIVHGEAGAPYRRGYLALREGRLLERAVRGLHPPPDVLLVNGTGYDHPRRAGLAVHLGSALDLATVGVTDRPLIAHADEPGPRRGDRSPLVVGGEQVGYLLRTRTRTRALYIHAAWRTTPEVAAEVIMGTLRRARTPHPLREARRLARQTRAAAEGRRSVQRP